MLLSTALGIRTGLAQQLCVVNIEPQISPMTCASRLSSTASGVRICAAGVFHEIEATHVTNNFCVNVVVYGFGSTDLSSRPPGSGQASVWQGLGPPLARGGRAAGWSWVILGGRPQGFSHGSVQLEALGRSVVEK